MITLKVESILSNIPPWPGIIDPESFFPKYLLNEDSIKSPKEANIPIKIAKTINSLIEKSLSIIFTNCYDA